MKQPKAPKYYRWTNPAVLSVLAVYFYIFMEWLFFVTKPSFMSNFNTLARLQILWIAPILPVIAGMVAVFIIMLPAIVLRGQTAGKLCTAAALLIPSAVLALALFIMIDNFTYTVFGFGVVSTSGLARAVYILFFVLIMVFSYQQVYYLNLKLPERSLSRRLGILSLALVVISISFVFAGYGSSSISAVKSMIKTTTIKEPFNIMIVASDGLNAENMSLYGYHRETTPFMKELAEDGLVCENCFANASTSGGSIVSMFTGKPPTKTRVIFPPDILHGLDSYQHLPGILKRLGYRNIDVSVRHHADPFDLNMRDSFDWANYRKPKQHDISGPIDIWFDEGAGYFMAKMEERLEDRLLHIFFLRRMQDPMAEVAEKDLDSSNESRWYTGTVNEEPGGRGSSADNSRYRTAPSKERQPETREENGDRERVDAFFSFIDEAASPFLAHLHLLGTHGSRYDPETRVFSAGKWQSSISADDFYDDAILSFDSMLRDIIEGLKERRLLDKTIIVICTDHGRRWKRGVRLPLIFLFPGGEHKGTIKENVQNMDIAATILDYLGVSRPGWMGGVSLISGNLDRDRPIFNIERVRGGEIKTKRGRKLDRKKTGPPFYTMGAIGVVVRNVFYELDLGKNILTVSKVKGHTDPAGEGELLSPEEAGKIIIDHLRENRYDVSSIVTPLAVRYGDTVSKKKR